MTVLAIHFYTKFKSYWVKNCLKKTKSRGKKMSDDSASLKHNVWAPHRYRINPCNDPVSFHSIHATFQSLQCIVPATIH